MKFDKESYENFLYGNHFYRIGLYRSDFFKGYGFYYKRLARHMLEIHLNNYYREYGIRKIASNVIKERVSSSSFDEFLTHYSMIMNKNGRISLFSKILFYIRIIFNKNKDKLYEDFIMRESAKILLDTTLTLKFAKIIQCLYVKKDPKKYSWIVDVFIKKGWETVFENNLIDAITYIDLCKPYIMGVGVGDLKKEEL